jgi:predicted restriction endonuclease
MALREGQEAFKRELISIHGPACMITGCKIEKVIEAAHIKPYRGIFDNSVGNGLLLRADIQKLFDDLLIGVDPQTLTVAVAKPLLGSEYEDFDGRTLVSDSLDLIEQDNLKLKWIEFVAAR